jgi:diguanylate cyclase (GGDEF)-like protein/PAS domain S-box-containing protein
VPTPIPDIQGTPVTSPDRKSRKFIARLLQMLGFNSIRGRYLLSVGLFISIVLIAGWAAQVVVNQAAHQSTVNTGERDQVHRILNDLNNDIWLTESAMQGFLLSPGKPQNKETLAALEHLLVDAEILQNTAWVQRNPRLQERVRDLTLHMSNLGRESSLLMDIRADAEKLFPAMRHMLDRMLPINVEFTTLATLAIDEAHDASENPLRHETQHLFSEARYAWVQMINAYRIFLANRFGIFPGDPEEGMKLQHSQVLFYHEKVTRHLSALTALEKQKALEFQQSESLSRMRTISRTWFDAYQTARTIYSSERWRADVPLLRDTIRPLLSRIWVELDDLRGELDSASADDMASLTGVASGLSQSLWVISLITIVLTIAGFLFFEHLVRRPIARVAAGLKAEASGQESIALPQTSTIETRELIDAFKHMRAQVHSRQQRLQTILENTAEGIVTFDADGTIESCNAAAKRLFGWNGDEAIGENITRFIVSKDDPLDHPYLNQFLNRQFSPLIGQEGELIALRRQQPFPMAIKLGTMQLDNQSYYTALVEDISERKAMLEHLRTLAEHDDLTNLYNRSYFMAELERVVERARRQQQLCTLLYIDLDNFKYVNDTLGHLAGDRLLVEVSQLLNRRARRGDLVARLGGDEFTMLLYGTRADEARSIAESFRKALDEYHFRHDGEVVNIGCSIGAATISEDTRSSQEALSHADFACHLAKLGGRNRIHVFEKEDEINVAAMSIDMGWSRRIKDAIRDNRFMLASQPIIHLQSGKAMIHEILVRLRDERDNIVMPDGFLPSADRFGLSADIDRWVIVNTIRQLAVRRQFVPELRYTINLSGQTLSQPDVAELIVTELDRQKLDPAALIFEVTETTAIADMLSAEAFLARLKSIGCKTALDDFGSGMSSFAYLRDLPVDIVKIDGRFVRNLGSNTVDQAMVRAMNDIAHALGKETIAEFVEGEDSLILLREIGVDYAQGFHMARPNLLGSTEQDADPTSSGKVVKLRPA